MPKHTLKRFRLFYKITLKPGHSLFGLLPVFSLCLLTLTGRSEKFPASSIPDSLKENADVVIRLEEITWDIKSPRNATRKIHVVYTILNDKGDEYATYAALYNNKSISLNSVSAYLYDVNGKEIRHFKKKDMEDRPYEDGISFVNDERYKRGGFSYNHYPYTVEFEEEDEFSGLMGIGDWEPQKSIKSSVETSVYSITVASDYELKFRMLNSGTRPVMAEKGGRKTYTWQVSNLSAYDEMPFSADYPKYAPHLLIALGAIEMEGFKGNMTTWNEYAKFYGSLQKGRDVLPEETKLKVHALTNGLPDAQAKVAALYTYLQQNSHYVYVQLGIGGWQTSEASYVATKKYGDCKALSNFMIAILKEVGIKANAVVIKGGEQDMEFVTDFTYDPFNHVICCVPLEKDTIWLECTDQFLPPGYLSDFTSNRYGLLIGDNGGKLVHTPAYLLSDNFRVRKISAVLDGEGNLNLESRTSYKAFCQDRVEKMIHHNSREDQLKILKSKFNLPTYDIASFNYQEDYSGRLPIIYESLQINVKDYAQVTGKRLFINPNILSRSGMKLTEDKNRRLDVELKEEYHYIDSVIISIPPGYTLESKSTNLVLNSNYGKYSNRMEIKGDKITYYRELEQYSGRFPAGEYGDVVKFYNEMYDADHTLIVLVKKN